MDTQLILCECNSMEHQLVIVSFPDDKEDIIYLQVHLTKKPFWKRVKTAIKHIFGHTSRYGDWDDFMINPEKLRNALEKIKK